MKIDDKDSSQRNFNWQLIIICAFYFVLHIPFLFLGYGVEEDSWGLVVNAKEMVQFNAYSASRLPGHPVHEYLLAWMYPATPFLYNLISAIAASITIFFCGLFFKKVALQKPLLASIAVGFCPVFFIAGTYTIDYALSLALLMIAWYLLAKKKTMIAALFLALSVGSRITNAAFLLPMLLFIGFEKENRKTLLWFTLISTSLSLLLFVPVIKRYGIYFFDYSDQFPYPTLPKFVYKATVGVFGFMGCLSLLLYAFKKFRSHNKVNLFIIISIIVTAIAYIRLPQKSAYLIPIIPFLVMAASQKLTQKAFVIFCSCFIVSGWICGINLVDKTRGSETKSPISISISGQTISFNPFIGNILADYQKRKIKADYVNDVLQKTDTLTHNSVIISGWWYNHLLVESESRKMNSNVHFVFYCDKDSLKNMQQNGMRIYYLEEQNVYNDLMFEMNVTNDVAKELEFQTE